MDPEPKAKRFESEQQCWEAGLELVLELRGARFGFRKTGPRTPEDMDRAIAAYCSALRRSDAAFDLVRLVREGRVSNVGIVLVLYAFCVDMGMFTGYWAEAVVLAAGFLPSRIMAVKRLDSESRGWGRFLRMESGRMHGSTALYDELGGPPLSSTDIESFKKQIADLPTRNEPDWKGAEREECGL